MVAISIASIVLQNLNHSAALYTTHLYMLIQTHANVSRRVTFFVEFYDVPLVPPYTKIACMKFTQVSDLVIFCSQDIVKTNLKKSGGKL